MRTEIHRQSEPGLSDESWCPSHVAFHRALLDAASNPIISYQFARPLEGIQPLINMIAFSARNREKIIRLHIEIADYL